jgi:peptidoglycan/LPS O-acetylase OafA/YrhL
MNNSVEIKNLPALTSLRGFAAWLVVFYHFKYFLFPHIPSLYFNIIAHGYLAVDFFFILSGFILTYVYHKNINDTSYIKFLLKRIARIYPLHFFMLILYLCVPIVILLLSTSTNQFSDLGYKYSLYAFARHLFLMNAWWPGPLTWNGPAWSISVEWFCYLFFPFILKGIYKVNRFTVLILLFITCVITMEVILSLNNATIGSFLNGMGLIRGWFEFTAGCILYKLSAQSYRKTTLFFFMSSILSLIGFYIYAFPLKIMILYSLFSLTILIISHQNILSKTLAFKPLEFNGDISYSVYLSHYFFFEFYKFIFVKDLLVTVPLGLTLIAFLAIFIFSIFSYRYIEKPSRDYLNNLTKNYSSGSLLSLSKLRSR